MTWLMINVPLMIVFLGLWVGIPTWLVLKRPDRRPVPAVVPVVRNLPRRPELSREDAGYQRVA
ncbi:MAG: hypothetical protein M3Z75_21355 [Actinomycetota bacterium]|nr:hypothetical protein [Actinomycetota bacterium]